MMHNARFAPIGEKCPIARHAAIATSFACATLAFCHISLGQSDDHNAKSAKKSDSVVLDSANPLGEPKKFDAGKADVYALWYADEAWHLRVTAAKHKDGKGDDREVFTGSVRVEGGRLYGQFQGLEPPKPVGPGSKKKMARQAAENRREADWVQVHTDGQGFDFRFVNFGKTDGLNFKVAPSGKNITFKFLIGGGDFPKRVLIGEKSAHPDKIPFVLSAHPEK